jgi:hypothetical protein
MKTFITIFLSVLQSSCRKAHCGLLQHMDCFFGAEGEGSFLITQAVVSETESQEVLRSGVLLWELDRYSC